ncbi:MAG TPA: universal stress protein [Thermoplasmatales archaeon]|nr:universal stress protein [Thermoplasmatales archaeon]
MVKEIGRIIVPVDGSEESKKAAKKALYIAKHINSSVVALYVMDTPLLARYTYGDDILTPDIHALLKKEGNLVLAEVERMGKRAGVRVIRKMVEGIPDEEIIKIARKKDLIVMGSKGKTALDRILVGSVSEKVIHHAPCAVMIVREREE